MEVKLVTSEMLEKQVFCDSCSKKVKWAWGSDGGSANQLVVWTWGRRVLAGGNAPKSFAISGDGLILHHLLRTKNFSGLEAAGK